MTLKIYNTLSRQKETFAPVDPDHVRIYVCGPTVYDYAHIGNARPVVVFDTLVRLLRATYPKVTYARNITDIDDKIIKRAEEEGRSVQEVTTEYTDVFHADMAALGAARPDIEPRATETVPAMIAMIERLLESGHAYEAEGHVLFHVPSMPDYGRLSGRDREEMVAGARVEVAPYKKDPADFVLWKPSSEDQPGWDSPWGRGRPGWHLECSAMIEAHLGETIDIHGGGQDLIFPHHENEIAQSVCAHHGTPFVKYWMHNGYLVVEGEKMSKSLGNYYTVHGLLEHYPGEAVRMALLSAQYRHPLDFSEDQVKAAKRQLDRWYRLLSDIPYDEGQTVPQPVLAALEDDLNTPAAIAELNNLASAAQKATDAEKPMLVGELAASLDLMGLLLQDFKNWHYGIEITESMEAGKSKEEIESLIAERTEARKNKDFKRADEIRDELAAAGIILEDKPEGTIWRRGQ